MADSDALTNKFHGALKKLQLFILDFDAVALNLNVKIWEMSLFHIPSEDCQCRL